MSCSRALGLQAERVVCTHHNTHAYGHHITSAHESIGAARLERNTYPKRRSHSEFMEDERADGSAPPEEDEEAREMADEEDANEEDMGGGEGEGTGTGDDADLCAHHTDTNTVKHAHNWRESDWQLVYSAVLQNTQFRDAHHSNILLSKPVHYSHIAGKRMRTLRRLVTWRVSYRSRARCADRTHARSRRDVENRSRRHS